MSLLIERRCLCSAVDPREWRMLKPRAVGPVEKMLESEMYLVGNRGKETGSRAELRSMDRRDLSSGVWLESRNTISGPEGS